VDRAFLLGGCLRSGKHREALAIRREIQAPYSEATGLKNLRVGPEGMLGPIGALLARASVIGFNSHIDLRQMFAAARFG
jgi:hypothetical protein